MCVKGTTLELERVTPEAYHWSNPLFIIIEA